MTPLECPGLGKRPSVFVVSLPRSLSTLVYHLVRLSLRLEAPPQVTDGEILNPDRLTPSGHGLAPAHGEPFCHPALAAGPCNELERCLTHLVQPRGFAYKDVVQPFVATRWLAGRDLRVLKIHRPLADVAVAMLGQGWRYPEAAAWIEEAPSDRFFEGLVRAEAALAALPGELVRYDDLVDDDSTLQAALDRLAGEIPWSVTVISTTSFDVAGT
jgi:hypothetical protein